MTITLTIDRHIQWRPGARFGRTSDGLRCVRAWWLFVAVGVYNRDDHDLLTTGRGWVS